MGQQQTTVQVGRNCLELPVDNIRELATELGLTPGLIYKWRAAYAFPVKKIKELSSVQTLLNRLQVSYSWRYMPM